MAIGGLFLLALSGTIRAARIECTEQALHAKIAQLNNSCTGDKTITFNCRNATIYINDDLNPRGACNNGDPGTSEFDCQTDQDCVAAGLPTPCAPNIYGCNSSSAGCTGAGQPYQCCASPVENSTCCSGNKFARDIHCNGVVIDGEDRNITFKLDPPCDARVGPASCTELENGAHLFRIRADSVTVRNITMTHFWKGLMTFGRDTVVENTVLNRGCDDVFTAYKRQSGYGPAVNAVLRSSVISNGCDKCVTLVGHDLPDSNLPYPNYNAKVLNNTFTNCRVPLQINDGRMLIEGNTFTVGNSPLWSAHSVQAGSPTQSGSTPVVYFKNNTVDGHWWNVRIRGGASFVSLGGNVFKNGRYVGFQVSENGRAFFEGDTFLDNGGTSGSEMGGLFVRGSLGAVDLGGGSLTIDGRTLSSAGNNQFINNRSNSGQLNVWNQTGVLIKAENNWWNTTVESTIAGRISGSVDFTPFLVAAPAPTSGAPPPPPNVWRTDAQGPSTN